MDTISISLQLSPLDESVIKEMDERIQDTLANGWTTQRQDGKYNNNYGRRHTAETRKKISEKAKGNKKRLGKKHSDETKAKMRAAKLGKPSGAKGRTAWNKGIPRTEWYGNINGVSR